MLHGRGLERGELGAAAHRTRDVDASGCFRSSGENEALQLGQHRVVLVAERLEAIDHRLGDTEALVGPREGNGEVGAEVEELVLDALEHRPQVRGKVGHREREAEQRVELVDDAVGLDAEIELRDP